MSALPDLPEGSVQTGAIHIVLGMSEDGNGIVFNIDGMSPETAVGHLRAVMRRIERGIDRNWAGEEEMSGIDVIGFHAICPECDEEIELDADEVDAITDEDDE